MKETDIRKYASLMKELGLTGLEITDDKKVVRLERNAVGYPVKEEYEQIRTGDMTFQEQKGVSGNDASYLSVKSPIVGVFYSASAENADPYVSIGDHVSKGQTLCIIEAMKLMNEITAEEDGVISKICVTDGQVIEYGTELFQISR